MASPKIKLEGRLKDANMSLATDPRMNPKMLAAMAPLGGGAHVPVSAVTANSPWDHRWGFTKKAHKMVTLTYNAFPVDLPSDAVMLASLDETTTTIKGVDDNDIKLHIFRPRNASGPLPCVIYTHGGGMTIATTYNPVHAFWIRSIASLGCVGVMVDYRNAYGAADGVHNPFPKGLNDCSSALDWVHAHRGDLGISKIVIQGESGGGNLAISTALKAKREGRLAAVDGVYGSVPFISGAYGWSRERMLAELPSLIENNGYYLDTAQMAIFVTMLDPNGEHATDPLLWPLNATEQELRGYPPTVISVNELDPLRDEGMVFYTKLAKAGVKVIGRTNLGIIHAAEMTFRKALPEVFWAAVKDIKMFADSLGKDEAAKL
ncbi:alpha/beta-hydrolase [Aulographum hederae CBS 113979]|uniref:Alpha/beta-hydrolase n=1 Tax=Aulographum hederae CBS 113979 TaxID=1176131 RepID=A0A6G1GN17_9PEZI|nr:alpha/beta-hydrolase [Aulographum hederae CBS 113979]